MTRWLLAAATIVLACACTSSNDPPSASRAVAATPIKTVAIAARERAKPGEIPAEITFPSAVGEVTFHHEMHFKDLGAKCTDCHHQIEAKSLNTPHPDYLHSSWVNCKGCHDDSGKARTADYSCSDCHSVRPANIADETLSAKVVIHAQCWKCHAAGTGKEASAGCIKCHSGKKA